MSSPLRGIPSPVPGITPSGWQLALPVEVEATAQDVPLGVKLEGVAVARPHCGGDSLGSLWGLQIVFVQPGSWAEKMGLCIGDTILRVLAPGEVLRNLQGNDHEASSSGQAQRQLAGTAGLGLLPGPLRGDSAELAELLKPRQLLFTRA